MKQSAMNNRCPTRETESPCRRLARNGSLEASVCSLAAVWPGRCAAELNSRAWDALPSPGHTRSAVDGRQSRLKGWQMQEKMKSKKMNWMMSVASVAVLLLTTRAKRWATTRRGPRSEHTALSEQTALCLSHPFSQNGY